jgi:hypothetical protein
MNITNDYIEDTVYNELFNNTNDTKIVNIP